MFKYLIKDTTKELDYEIDHCIKTLDSNLSSPKQGNEGFSVVAFTLLAAIFTAILAIVLKVKDLINKIKDSIPMRTYRLSRDLSLVTSGRKNLEELPKDKQERFLKLQEYILDNKDKKVFDLDNVSISMNELTKMNTFWEDYNTKTTRYLKGFLQSTSDNYDRLLKESEDFITELNQMKTKANTFKIFSFNKDHELEFNEKNYQNEYFISLSSYIDKHTKSEFIIDKLKDKLFPLYYFLMDDTKLYKGIEQDIRILEKMLSNKKKVEKNSTMKKAISNVNSIFSDYKHNFNLISKVKLMCFRDIFNIF